MQGSEPLRGRIDSMTLFQVLLSLEVEENNVRKDKRWLPHLSVIKPVIKGKLKIRKFYS
jgi:hypothetical protein